MKDELTIDDIKDNQFGVMFRVSNEMDMPWKYIKEQLVQQIMRQIIPPMLDSGHYHVVKFDIGKRPVSEYAMMYDCTEYFIRADVHVAQTRQLVIAEMTLPKFDYHGVTYERVCQHCGNALRLDERGGCKGCGAPNGGYR